MASKRKVVLTGAAGQIARQLIPSLRDWYDLKMLDVRSSDSDGHEIDGIEIADLRDKHWQKYQNHFRGADAIVHCAFSWGGAAIEPTTVFRPK